MSLRLRAVLMAGIAMLALWALAAAWMMRGVHANLERTLDDRLAMSARMVSSLLHRAAVQPAGAQAHWADIIRVTSSDGIACEIRSLQGAVLAQTDEGPYSLSESLPEGYSTREVDGKLWRIYLRQDNGGYQIMTADRMDRRDALLNDMLRAAGVPFLIAVMGGLLALWIGIDRGLAPLVSLRQILRKRPPEDMTPLDSGGAVGELRPVIAAMNGWLGRLSQTLNDQRAFTDAAAHELRTPLTAIDTHLQVAQITQGAQAEASLRQAGQGVQRLRHTLEQMMTLARTEAPVHADDTCASITAVVREVTQRLDSAPRARVRFSAQGEDAGSRIPRSMLDTAVRNLLDNALRYAPAASPVEIHLQFGPAGGPCTISVADRGPGLSEQQSEQVGQRFWRGDQGRGNGDGAGLGISIVRAIVGRFGGSLQLLKREGGGLLARLDVPAPGK